MRPALSHPFAARCPAPVRTTACVPVPLFPLRDGQEAVFHVRSRLAVIRSIHWHGIPLPPEMDCVPGVTFAGIPARRDVSYHWPGQEPATFNT
jgi:FtsP/CotA-like multicopper oxidase with cupredoxin domain